MKYLTLKSTSPHYNMAFDEFCLENLPLDEPVFYLWQNRPSVIIGRNQNPYAEVNLAYLQEKGIVLARRVTGGGAVYHDLENLNYTIMGRSQDLESDYPGYLTLVVDALRKLGAYCTLSGRNDIMVDGRKCSGYAKRVFKDRLMVHGTLMFDVDLEELSKALSLPRSKFTQAGVQSVRSKVANLRDYLPGIETVGQFQQALQEILSGGDDEVVLTPEQLSLIEKERVEKFSTWDWLYGKSPEASFRTGGKFSCGTIEATFNVQRGLIGDLRLGGDFIGNLAPEGICTTLEGCKFEYGEILSTLSRCNPPVGAYFDSLTPEEFARLLVDIQG